MTANHNPPSDDDVTAAEAMLRSLKANGVDYLFSNLGSDHPPILEALARTREAGTREELETALDDALDAMAEGRPATIDVVIEPM